MTFGHRQPRRSTRMLVDKISQIVQCILNAPQTTFYIVIVTFWIQPSGKCEILIFFFLLASTKDLPTKINVFFFSSWKYMILMSENDFKSSKIFKINKWNTLDCLGHFSHKMTVAHSLWARSLLERPFSGWKICWLLFTIKQIQILKLYPPNYECIHNRNNWQIAPKYWKYFVYISTHWMQSKMRYLFFSAKMSIMDMLIISKHYQK